MLGGMYLMGELEDNKISCPTAQHYYKMAGEYGEWGQDIRKGFDAFLRLCLRHFCVQLHHNPVDQLGSARGVTARSAGCSAAV